MAGADVDQAVCRHLFGHAHTNAAKEVLGRLLPFSLRVLLVLLQEESEASYQAAFPDHFAAFADVATLADEVVPADLEEAGSSPKGDSLHPLSNE